MAINKRFSAIEDAVLSTPFDGWSDALELKRCGNSGILSYVKGRSPAGGTVTAGEVMVFTATETEEAAYKAAGYHTVPVERRVYYYTGITLTPSATDASHEDNVMESGKGQVFDVRNRYGVASKDRRLWVASRGTAGASSDYLVWALHFRDCE